MSATKSLCSLRDFTNRRIDDIDRIIENVSKNVLEITSHRNRCELEDHLTLVKLRRERLRAMNAVARAQAIVFEMEKLIAESELSGEVGSLKRKTSVAGSPTSAKKAKLYENKDEKASKRRPTAKSSRNTKTLKEVSDIQKKTTEDKQNKERKADIDKENRPLALNNTGKQIIILNNPPYRKKVCGDKTGFITAKCPLELRYAEKDKSIYSKRNLSELFKEVPNIIQKDYTKKTAQIDETDCDALIANFNKRNSINYSTKERCCHHSQNSSSIPKRESTKEDTSSLSTEHKNEDVISMNERKQPICKKEKTNEGHNQTEFKDESTNELFRVLMGTPKIIKVEYDAVSISSLETVHIGAES